LALRLKLKLWENPCWYLQVFGLTSMSFSTVAFRKIEDRVLEEKSV
jgi:hypothetical protein